MADDVEALLEGLLRPRLDRAKVAIERILSTPMVDPGAPVGFIRRHVGAAEGRRRIEAIRVIVEELLDNIEGDLGPDAARAARKHVEPIYASAATTFERVFRPDLH
jgi:hypothetical protein